MRTVLLLYQSVGCKAAILLGFTAFNVFIFPLGIPLLGSKFGWDLKSLFTDSLSSAPWTAATQM